MESIVTGKRVADDFALNSVISAVCHVCLLFLIVSLVSCLL